MTASDHLSQVQFKPGERVARYVRKGSTVLLPGSDPGTHDAYKAASEPYEENGEYWVDVHHEGDTFPLPLHGTTLPI